MNTPRMLAALALGLSLSFGASAGEMGRERMRMMDMPMMKDHVTRMHDNVEKLKAAKSDKERIRLMQEHMEMADEHMMMVKMMDERMDARDDAKGMPCERAGDKDDHEAHH